jgi:elongation factor 1-beta
VIITARIMPESPDVDLDQIIDSAKNIVNEFGQLGKTETMPIAFGLKAVIIHFIVPEKEGGTDDVEKKLSEIPNVQSVEIVDVRRAL